MEDGKIGSFLGVAGEEDEDERESRVECCSLQEAADRVGGQTYIIRKSVLLSDVQGCISGAS